MPYTNAIIIFNFDDTYQCRVDITLIDIDNITTSAPNKLRKSEIRLMTTCGIRHYIVHEIYDTTIYNSCNSGSGKLTNVYNFRTSFINTSRAFIIYITGTNENYTSPRRLSEEEIKRFTYGMKS